MNKSGLDIIRSPTAERMIQSVTRDFYDRAYIGQWLFEVMGREYDETRGWTESLRHEIFPAACTWSIAVWERVYGVPTDETLPLEYRRARIAARKLQRPPINPAQIENMLSALTGCPVAVTENTAPYTFSFEINESAAPFEINYTAMLKTLRAMKPSHLSFNFSSFIAAELWGTDYDAGATSDWITEFFTGDESPARPALDYSGAAASELLAEFFTEASPAAESAEDEHITEVSTE